MLTGLNKLPSVLRGQVLEITILVVATLGIGVVRWLVDACLGHVLLFGVVPISHIYDAAHLLLFVRLFFRILALKS